MISLGFALTANQLIYGIDEKIIRLLFLSISGLIAFISEAATSNTARTACLIRENSSCDGVLKAIFFIMQEHLQAQEILVTE
jgi:hypothetical protein